MNSLPKELNTPAYIAFMESLIQLSKARYPSGEHSDAFYITLLRFYGVFREGKCSGKAISDYIYTHDDEALKKAYGVLLEINLAIIDCVHNFYCDCKEGAECSGDHN